MIGSHDFVNDGRRTGIGLEMLKTEKNQPSRRQSWRAICCMARARDGEGQVGLREGFSHRPKNTSASTAQK